MQPIGITGLLLISISLISANVIQLETLHKSEPVSDETWLKVNNPSRVISNNPSQNFEISKYLNEIKTAWSSFKTKFNREYNTVVEEGKRFIIFAETFLKIKRHNSQFNQGKKTFKMGINQFSDMTESEFKVYRGYRQSLNGIKGSTFLSSAVPVTLPSTVDWRKKGAVTPVKNQGQCGSCWAFSTTGSLEGQNFRSTGKLVSLSEEQLVDCSKENNGCNGGLMDLAFAYIKKNKGLDTEKSYPYVSGNSSEKTRHCKYSNRTIGATVKGFSDIPEKNEEKLQEAVAQVGPVSVAIDAGHSSFQSYESGVYDEPECSEDNLDHGVLVVGYGVENGTDYWLVKNSWAEKWGEQGYIKMRRNNDNMCGIASKASYPLV